LRPDRKRRRPIVIVDWQDFLAGLALYLIIEGALPFLSPDGWRRSIALINSLSAGQLRLFGLGSMLAGLVLLVAVRAG
jgi:uncharacterized protein